MDRQLVDKLVADTLPRLVDWIRTKVEARRIDFENDAPYLEGMLEDVEECVKGGDCSTSPSCTVLLLYPDYLGTDNPRGFETYLGHGMGRPEEAVAQVQQEAAAANNHDHEDDFAAPDDFAVLAVFEGWHQDIKPEE